MVRNEPMRNENIVELLRQVVKLSDILFVMGKGPKAVMEGWVNCEETQVTVEKEWIAVESRPWHCHLHLPEVTSVWFVEEQDPHDPKRQAFNIRLLRKDGEPLLMIFFSRIYDGSGVLSQEKVVRFRALKEQYGL